MKGLSLTDIIDYRTVGGDHLSGEARFSDGKRYRFVVVQPFKSDKPAVTSMARPTKSWDGREVFNHNDHKPVVYPKRAALIIAAYPAYLEQAQREKAERDAGLEAIRKRENETYQRDKALREAAPDLLEALQHIADRAERGINVKNPQHGDYHRCVFCRAHHGDNGESTEDHSISCPVTIARAAILKATTIPTIS